MPNDFTRNPRGSGASGTGVDFTRSPGGSTNGSPAPQATGEASDLSTADAAPGGRVLMADARPDPSKDIGVGSIGNGAKPFRLEGG